MPRQRLKVDLVRKGSNLVKLMNDSDQFGDLNKRVDYLSSTSCIAMPKFH